MKGISPFVAMILLILITIVIAGAMAFWAQQYVTEKTENATQQEQTISRCMRTGLNILSSNYDSGSNILSLVIENNQFETITSLDIQLISNSNIYKITQNNLTAGSLSGTIKPSDITLIKIDTTNIQPDNYTLRIRPNDCVNSVRNMFVEIS